MTNWFLAFVLFSQVDIQVAENYPAHSKIVFTVTGAAKDASVLWEFTPEQVETEEITGPQKVAVWAAPGTYYVRCDVIDWNAKKASKVRKKFTVGPAPVPTPQPNPTPQPTPIQAATAVTYIYEKDQNSVPPQVLSGLNRLNREQGIVATIFEVDTKDGTGDTPEQYKVPVAAAKTAGLPTLVTTGKERQVLRVIRNPKSEAEVMEAVK